MRKRVFFALYISGHYTPIGTDCKGLFSLRNKRTLHSGVFSCSRGKEQETCCHRPLRGVCRRAGLSEGNNSRSRNTPAERLKTPATANHKILGDSGAKKRTAHIASSLKAMVLYVLPLASDIDCIEEAAVYERLVNEPEE